MKITFRKVDEKSGFIRKTIEHTLFVKVELDKDEREAINAAGIDDYLLMDYEYKGTHLPWKVKSLLYADKKGTESRFVGEDQLDRNRIEGEVKEALKSLKNVIDNQSSLGESEESFEL